MSIILISIALTFFLKDTTVYGSDKKETYKIVIVQKGDTLWSITSNNCNSYSDIRKAIYEIKKFNNIASADIYPGQELKIPVKLYKN